MDEEWIDAETTPPFEPGNYQTEWVKHGVEGLTFKWLGVFDGAEWLLERKRVVGQDRRGQPKQEFVMKPPAEHDQLVRYRRLSNVVLKKAT